MSNTPSDEELDSVLCHHWPAFPMQAVLVKMWLRDAMRETLAKWGTPQPVVREPLSDEQVVDLYFDGFSISKLKDFARAIEQAHGITKQGGSNVE